MKKALVFGITGQDGAYLAELLLKKKYKVFGIKRRSSTFNTQRIDHIFNNPNLKLYYGDLIDPIFINFIIKKTNPDEIYNLAAQSHVAVSFKIPEYTSNVNSLGCLRILEAIRSQKNYKKIKFYQAGTSEMYGRVQQIPQDENTPFYPRSPYGFSKVFAHWATKNYREAYGIFACNGILFNHESPRRGETFVTRKITMGLSAIKLGLQKKLVLGNLNAKRDWGHAKDYVVAQWLILQQKEPGDYVVSSGKTRSVKEFVDIASQYLGIKIKWKGKGINTKGYDKSGKCIIECNKKYFRPAEVDQLVGNPKKAKKNLRWRPKITFKEMIKEMIDEDIKLLRENRK